jgi:hypothetical protein
LTIFWTILLLEKSISRLSKSGMVFLITVMFKPEQYHEMWLWHGMAKTVAFKTRICQMWFQKHYNLRNKRWNNKCYVYSKFSVLRFLESNIWKSKSTKELFAKFTFVILEKKSCLTIFWTILLLEKSISRLSKSGMVFLYRVYCSEPHHLKNYMLIDLRKDDKYDLLICNLTLVNKCPVKCSCYFQPSRNRTVVDCSGL